MSSENPTEQQAVEALQAKNYEAATNMFFQIYERGAADNDRDLTHSCVAMWMGVQRYCDTASQLHICSKTSIGDVGYASELFIACLFRIHASNQDLISPTADKIRETVERANAVLEHLVSVKHSTYAISWHANVLRGMGNFAECRRLIEEAFKSPTLPTSVANQIRGCRENISEYDQDSASACQYVMQAFPQMAMIDIQKVNSLHDSATRIWKMIIAVDKC